MTKYLEWVEPFLDQAEPVICRIKVEDAIKALSKRPQFQGKSREDMIDYIKVNYHAVEKEYLVSEVLATTVELWRK